MPTPSHGTWRPSDGGRKVRPLREVAAALNGRGILTRRGGRWHVSNKEFAGEVGAFGAGAWGLIYIIR